MLVVLVVCMRVCVHARARVRARARARACVPFVCVRACVRVCKSMAAGVRASMRERMSACLVSTDEQPLRREAKEIRVNNEGQVQRDEPQYQQHNVGFDQEDHKRDHARRAEPCAFLFFRYLCAMPMVHAEDPGRSKGIQETRLTRDLSEMRPFRNRSSPFGRLPSACAKK